MRGADADDTRRHRRVDDGGQHRLAAALLHLHLAAFRDAQRAMLDQLSAGVAQFDAKRQLTFANQPFQRLFALKPGVMIDPPQFERLLDLARDMGRVPEARDFPAWRRERVAWFLASEAQEEAWVLADGTQAALAHWTPESGWVDSVTGKGF